MIDSVNAVNAVQVVSSYTKVYPVKDSLVFSQVKHLQDRGASFVEAVNYVSYTSQAELERSHSSGTNIDVVT